MVFLLILLPLRLWGQPGGIKGDIADSNAISDGSIDSSSHP
jgi:hypothetical protein